MGNCLQFPSSDDILARVSVPPPPPWQGSLWGEDRAVAATSGTRSLVQLPKEEQTRIAHTASAERAL